jgi:hypothetical protein
VLAPSVVENTKSQLVMHNMKQTKPNKKEEEIK